MIHEFEHSCINNHEVSYTKGAPMLGNVSILTSNADIEYLLLLLHLLNFRDAFSRSSFELTL